MKVSSLLKGGIYEVSFGYNPKMEGYATLMSDIPELREVKYYSGTLPNYNKKDEKLIYKENFLSVFLAYISMWKGKKTQNN